MQAVAQYPETSEARAVRKEPGALWSLTAKHASIEINCKNSSHLLNLSKEVPRIASMRVLDDEKGCSGHCVSGPYRSDLVERVCSINSSFVLWRQTCKTFRKQIRT
jgi:hypothetical protein